MASGVAETETSRMLRVAWGEWLRIVQRFAGQGCGRHDVSGEFYRSLYSSLQQRIEQSQVEGTLDAEQLKLMRDLSEPWITVESLASADRKLLEELTGRCSAVHPDWRSYGFQERKHFSRSSVIMFCGVLLAGLAGLAIWQGLLDWSSLDVTDSLLEWVRNIRRNHAMVHSGLLIMAATISILAVTWMVFRPPGRY
ncbi:MAG: hypothetical protein RLZZ232_616 [Planctomycetota bacterium]|jgi:hypothetical protein